MHMLLKQTTEIYRLQQVPITLRNIYFMDQFICIVFISATVCIFVKNHLIVHKFYPPRHR